MKIWITKYALTKGILEVDGEICADTSTEMVKYGGYQYVHREGRDWHRTRESAIARAEVMRKTKIAALTKHAQKLRGMRFQ